VRKGISEVVTNPLENDRKVDLNCTTSVGKLLGYIADATEMCGQFGARILLRYLKTNKKTNKHLWQTLYTESWKTTSDERIRCMKDKAEKFDSVVRSASNNTYSVEFSLCHYKYNL
jgi:hypothetical protein